jgi:hypothetical protein
MAAALRGKQFRATGFEHFGSEGLAQTGQEIRTRAGPLLWNWNQGGDDAASFGDLDLLPLAQKVFDFREPIAQISDTRVSHVTHYSITKVAAASLEFPHAQPLQGFLAQAVN